MNKEDKKFLEQCCYFWIYKQDMTRYSSFDPKRLEKLNPLLYTAWFQYTLNVNMLDSITKDLYNEL